MTDNNNNNSPHTNTFLKNLSQKKYAWMEEASSLQPQQGNKEQKSNTEVPQRKTSSPTTKKTTKTKRLSPEPEVPSPSSVVSKKHKSPTSKVYNKSPVSPPSPTIIQQQQNDMATASIETASRPLETAAEDFNTDASNQDTNANKDKETPLIEEKQPRKPQPHFKYTAFPVKGYNILPTRNITSTFARNDTTYFPGNKAGAEEIAPNVSLRSFSQIKAIRLLT
jgi:actin-related protein 8